MSRFRTIFPAGKPLIAMAHVPALPGTPLFDAKAGLAGAVEVVRRDVDVLIEPGAAISQATQLEGRTIVGAGARVGPNCQLRDTTVGAGATVLQAVCEDIVIEPGAVIGPFAHLKPGAGDQQGSKRDLPAGAPAAASSSTREHKES